MRPTRVVLGAAVASLALVAQAGADVLVNYVPARNCYRPNGSIELGVWFKAGGDIRKSYRVEVLDAARRVVFTRSGVAPSTAWRYWRVAVPRGRYTVYYRLPTGTQRYVTNVVRC